MGRRKPKRLTAPAWCRPPTPPAGVNLPRVAQSQYDATTPVPAGQPLQPGDLVFFGTDTKHITHVGIVTGDGTMVDAPHSGAVVRIEPYSWPDYLGATRPTNRRFQRERLWLRHFRQTDPEREPAAKACLEAAAATHRESGERDQHQTRGAALQTDRAHYRHHISDRDSGLIPMRTEAVVSARTNYRCLPLPFRSDSVLRGRLCGAFPAGTAQPAGGI